MGDIANAEEIVRNYSFRLLPSIIEKLPESGFVSMPWEWAEENRYIPPDVTDFPGMFDICDVPQYKEILENQHPDNPVQTTAVVKPVQSAFTTSVLENVSGWAAHYKLGNQLHLQSTKSMMEVKSSSSIDSMIDNSGLFVRSISKRNKRKKSDKALYKELDGGVKFLMTSWGSPADHKSVTFSIILGDELDEGKQSHKGQGSVVSTLEGRGFATGFFKMIFGCTSSDVHTSQIWREHNRGTQKKYFVPCPICGDPQILLPKMNGRDYGLTFNMMKDSVTGSSILDTSSVRYICQHCKREFFEEHKRNICNRGFWEPTWMNTNFKPEENYESYQFNALISQQLDGGWNSYCRSFIKTKFGKDIELYKAHTINMDGMPWAHVDKQYTWKQLKERSDVYSMGCPPENAGLLIFMGVDVQKDRLEGTAVAFAPGFEMCIVDSQVWYGDTSDLNDRCWSNMDNYVTSSRFTIKGIDVSINQVAIDTNWDPNESDKRKSWQVKAHTVMQFVDQHGGGVEGYAQDAQYVAIYGGNERSGVGMIEQKRVKGDAISIRYEVSTSKFKHIIMGNIDKHEGPYSIRVPMYRKPEGGIDIDVILEDNWYMMFMSERWQELSTGQYGWHKVNARNEVLDCVVYAMACAYLQGCNGWSYEMWEDIENNMIQDYYQ